MRSPKVISLFSSMLIASVLLTGSAAQAATKSILEIKAAPQHEGVVFDQYYLACLSQASYLIGDKESKTAVLVDPERDIDKYVKDAEAQGLTITHVILTHVHADFIAGHIESEKRLKTKICMGYKADAKFKFEPLKENDIIKVGRLNLKVLETPGHTTESISILVYDTKQNADKPYAVLTGDCLFIGDVGRPDLMATLGVTAKELAGLEYDSLHDKLMKLPDETLVYPAHGAGSLCGKNLSSETVSTMGEQRKSNYALQDMSKEKFVSLLTNNQPKPPKYWGFERKINLNAHKTLEEAVAENLKPIKVDAALESQSKDKAQILDVREADDFAKQYVKGTVNIPLSGHYAFWAGNFLDINAPIVVIAPQGKEREAVLRLGRIGFDNVTGYVDGGIDAFSKHQELLTSTNRRSANDLAKSMHSTNPPVVVDIRNDMERKESFIEGTTAIPLMNLLDESDKLPKDKEIVVQCATGFRSSIAASLLRKKGFEKVSDLSGGITAWKENKLPVTGSTTCKAAD